jgi:hypothetical protein
MAVLKPPQKTMPPKKPTASRPPSDQVVLGRFNADHSRPHPSTNRVRMPMSTIPAFENLEQPNAETQRRRGRSVFRPNPKKSFSAPLNLYIEFCSTSRRARAHGWLTASIGRKVFPTSGGASTCGTWHWVQK